MKIEIAEETQQDVYEEIRVIHSKRDWRGAVDFLNSGKHKPLLLWLRPTFSLFEFIAGHLRSHSVNKVISIGCGTGLLEWLIQSAIPDVDIAGVEVDRDWWSSTYAPPVFHPLSYPDEPDVKDKLTQNNAALLFCYFNCEPAWQEYLKQFKGPLVIVCGPMLGSGTHSNPRPYQTLTPEWEVIGGENIGTTHDAVVIYARKSE